MSTRKSTTKTQKKPRCKTYAQQAAAIEKRRKRAEDNEIFDTILAAEYKRIQARATLDLLFVAPDYIKTAIFNTLDAAAMFANIPMLKFADDRANEINSEAIEHIADIFTLAHGYKATDPNSPRALAEHLSALIAHPLIPVDLLNALSDELASLDDYLDRGAPEYFEKVLIAYHADKQLLKEGGAR